MLHRAILGSFERFIGILLENYAGRLPMWIAPVQVVVASITTEANTYALEVAKILKGNGIRTEMDLRNEKINYKIREHSVGKIPAIIILGKRELEERKLVIRRLGKKEQDVLALDEAIVRLKAEGKLPASN